MVRAVVGAVDSSWVHPVGSSVSAAAAARAVTARNAVVDLCVFLIRESMGGLYTACIHTVYSPLSCARVRVVPEV